MLATLLVLAGTASGSEVWAALHNGRLVAAGERDPAQAATIYEVLLEDLTEEDEHIRDDLLRSLGQARFESGDIPGAIAALEQTNSPEAAALRALIAVWAAPVTALPYTDTAEVALSANSSWRLAIDGVRPDTMALRLRADESIAVLRLTLTDLEGRVWEQELLDVADDEWQEMTITLRDLRPHAGTTGLPRDGLWMLAIAPADTLQGAVWISGVELR